MNCINIADLEAWNVAEGACADLRLQEQTYAASVDVQKAVCAEISV